MSTSDAFRKNILLALYNDASKGVGTDIQVLIPAGKGNHAKQKFVTFHLHGSIASASSDYFAKFPEPKEGRVIDDIDSNAFSLCVKYMYLGDCEDLSHDNVAAVLDATALLQMKDLKQKCIDYLDSCLDHANYIMVMKLADRFNALDLKKNAQRFQTENTSRDVLLAKRAALVKEVDGLRHSKDVLIEREQKKQKTLDLIDEQLKEAFEKQHKKMLSSQWENKVKDGNGGEAGDDGRVPFAFGHFKKKGSVGHIVLPQPDKWTVYDGSSTYDPNKEEEEVDVDGIEGYEYNEVSKRVIWLEGAERLMPPQPTKEQFEMYGIMHSHDSIITAIKKAQDGDRIYLGKGVHWDANDHSYGAIKVDKSLEIIGLGLVNEVVFEIDYSNADELNSNPYTSNDDSRALHECAECFKIDGGNVSFFNITFRVRDDCAKNGKTYHPKCSQGSGDDAIISFDDGLYNWDPSSRPSVRKLVIKNCCFMMGTTAKSSFATRVSGVFIKRSSSATIEGCKFLGGSGSSIVVLNDPYLYTPDVHITNNTFLNNGQPTFSECEGSVCRDVALDQVPGPSSVEVWKVERHLYTMNNYDPPYKEEPNRIAVNLTGNTFTSNLRAPLAHRSLYSRYSSDIIDDDDDIIENEWRLRIVKEDGMIKNGDRFTFESNTMRNNGAQFVNEDEPFGKDEDGKVNPFPDGNSVINITHYITDKDKKSFPDSCYLGAPSDAFVNSVDEKEWHYSGDFCGGD